MIWFPVGYGSHIANVHLTLYVQAIRLICQIFKVKRAYVCRSLS